MTMDLLPEAGHRTVRLSRLFRLVNGGTPGPSEANWDGDVVWVTPTDLALVDGGEVSTSTRTLTETGLATGSNLVPAGSLVLSTRAPVGYVSVAGVPLSTNQGCKTLVPRGPLEPRYYMYCLQVGNPVLQAISNGTTFLELGSNQLLGLRVPAPSLQEQRRVVGQIDEQMQRMDQLTNECLSQLELLTERDRTAVRRLVTGAEAEAGKVQQGPWWLAPTPASWLPNKLGRVFRTGSGTTPSTSEPRFYGPGTMWLNTGECRDAVVYETKKSVTDEALRELSALKLYPAGSLVIAMYGATIGRLAILGTPMTVNQACCVLHSPTVLDTRFVFWWFWAHRAELLSIGVGGGQANINQEIIKQIQIPAPGLDEQLELVRRIETQIEATRRLRDEVEQQLTLIKDHRRAAVIAALTGQEQS